MGALKGRFMCLKGLPIVVRGHEEHMEVMRWISVCCILHNLCIDVEGAETHNQAEALDGWDIEGNRVERAEGGNVGGAEKRERLIDELIAHRQD